MYSWRFRRLSGDPHGAVFLGRKSRTWFCHHEDKMLKWDQRSVIVARKAKSSFSKVAKRFLGGKSASYADDPLMFMLT